MISVIDYGAGNIASVCSALVALGYVPQKVSRVEEFPKETSTIFLPGVGDGSFMMKELSARGFIPLLESWARDDKPLLGICVGAQVLLSFTDEGDTPCLDIIEGRCRDFSTSIQGDLKIPHMGWNQLVFDREERLFWGLPDDANVYFVHSYYLLAEDRRHSLATTRYGVEFDAVIGKGQVVGTQFHPEKSGKWGLQIIDNFLTYYGKEATRQKGYSDKEGASC